MALRRRIDAVLFDEAGSTAARPSPIPSTRGASIKGHVDVVVVALPAPPRRSASAIGRCRDFSRDAAVVALLEDDDRRLIRRLLDAGVVGVVFEHNLDESLAITVEAVGAGQFVLPQELQTHAERPALSHREREILRLVAEGRTNAEIAAELYLAESTVKSHLTSTYTKLGVASRNEASALVLDWTGSVGDELLERAAAGAGG
jgi:DNA-binding NarL/FixJ family response regulator